MSALKELRLAAGIKGVVLCQLLGLDPGRYSRLELCQVEPRAGEMERIRSLLERLVALRREFWLLDFNNPAAIKAALDWQAAAKNEQPADAGTADDREN